MTKLDELMELNKAVDIVIASAKKENETTRNAITEIGQELWNKMWDDIDEIYKYFPIIMNKPGEPWTKTKIDDIHINYGYSSEHGYRYSCRINLFYTWTGLEVGDSRITIERNNYNKVKKHYPKQVATLLLNWETTKESIKKEIENRFAECVKLKIENMATEIENDENLLDALLKVLTND